MFNFLTSDQVNFLSEYLRHKQCRLWGPFRQKSPFVCPHMFPVPLTPMPPASLNVVAYLNVHSGSSF